MFTFPRFFSLSIIYFVFVHCVRDFLRIDNDLSLCVYIHEQGMKALLETLHAWLGLVECGEHSTLIPRQKQTKAVSIS